MVLPLGFSWNELSRSSRMSFLQCAVFKVRRQFTFCPLISCANFGLLKLSDGDNEIRTRDPLLARQVLSQLSYTPAKT